MSWTKLAAGLITEVGAPSPEFEAFKRSVLAGTPHRKGKDSNGQDLELLAFHNKLEELRKNPRKRPGMPGK